MIHKNNGKLGNEGVAIKIAEAATSAILIAIDAQYM